MDKFKVTINCSGNKIPKQLDICFEGNDDTVSVEISFAEKPHNSQLKESFHLESETKKEESNIPNEAEIKKEESNTPNEAEIKKEESNTPNEAETKKEESNTPNEAEIKKEESNIPNGISDGCNEQLNLLKQQKIIGMDDIIKFAADAKSYAEIVNLIINIFDFDEKRREILKNLLTLPVNNSKITWKTLEEMLKGVNLSCSQYDKICLIKAIHKKMTTEKISLLIFIRTIRGYNKEECIAKTKIRMNCMPENEKMKEVLASLDKEQSVEKRIRYVLEAMGLNTLTLERQKRFIEIVKISIEKGIKDIEAIFISAGVPAEQVHIERMAFSQFINDYIKENGSCEKMKLQTFFEEMQKILKDEKI